MTGCCADQAASWTVYAMRLARSCRQCRETKRRCRRNGPGEPCETCRSRRLACEGDIRHQQPRPHGQPPPLLPKAHARIPPVAELASQITVEATNPQAQHSQGQEPSPVPLELSPGTAMEMVELYLSKINNGRPHSLFHPATLRSQVQGGTLKRCLLYAICAIGCRYSANPDTRAREPRLVAEAKRLLQLGIEDVCLEHVQACILIKTVCIDSSNAAEALYHRIASAMADVLRLNSLDTQRSTPLVVAEMRRRAWWTLYLSDNWCVSGLGVLSPIKHQPIVIDLPMDEADFLTLPVNHPAPPQGQACRPGPFAQKIRLSTLFELIQDLNRRVAAGGATTTELDREVEVLSGRLEDWKQGLPPGYEMSMDNIHRHQERGSGASFVLMHMAYHYFATLLYFRFLEGSNDTQARNRPRKRHQHKKEEEDTTSPESYKVYVERCKHNASAFSSLLRRARQLRDCEPIFPMIGHLATVSSSVLLHTLLFGDATELEAARDALQANFEALMELRRYWPATSAMVSRLVTFQNTCVLWSSRSSSPKNTHRLDGWMLRYLLERNLNTGQDTVPSPSSCSEPQNDLAPAHVEPWEFDNHDGSWLASRASDLAETVRYMDLP
ncbi:uncharacterized protein B0I36DRAFT_338927 [Microdochium trichocladiopsis]|uniref:Zn(2)-C6 fungal-type domain-containing protein n=1 Tax=Microdochium trichocladiopsis TaxID=1682393 RepID=A0A9P8XU26_9PEZI|nr:uncharacterized protein B0I36DRAFT_338927 [Microdochium trichocladiopsis]KAH7014586.1 hypothetical protein B0I36DRAFT_338927 [Microdochium trichocladiopsis]